MSPLKAWIWLSLLQGLERAQTAALLRYFGGPEQVYEADRAELAKVEGISENELNTLSNRSFDEAERVIELCARKNVKVLCMQDVLYPERLRSITDAPAVLYYAGKIPVFDEEPAIAIVGPRHPSAYGIRVAESIACELAAAGCIIVSGLAVGIDGAAHRGALKAGGRTVAVTGCGIDVDYPTGHSGMKRDIAAKGVVMSELPPGAEPVGKYFPVRNRIISGLSVGTLVIDAPKRSGSLITARHAMEQGRDIFAVPANIGQIPGQGANALIRQNIARLITCADDILSEYTARFPHKIRWNPPEPAHYGQKYTPRKSEEPEIAKPQNAEAVKPPARPEGLSPVCAAVFDALALGGEPHVDEIVGKTGLNARQVLAALTMLEVMGTVVQLPGKHFMLSTPG